MNKTNKVQCKLIFNPKAGNPEESPVQLLETISQLQQRQFDPELYLIESESELATVIKEALERGIQFFIVCGGDGTIENALEPLVNTDATLGIIPTGTRNNIALGLGIPKDISAVVDLLSYDKPIKMDIGQATCGKQSRFFLETCSIGLLSALYPAADEIQHGNLARIGDFLSTLVTSPSAEMHLRIDGKQELHLRGHVILITNLPYIGPNYQVASQSSVHDGLLDLFVFPDQSKLDLLNQVVSGEIGNAGVEHYQIQTVHILTYPAMPVMADGFSLGEGPVTISVKKAALSIISGKVAQFHKLNQDEPVILHAP